jgi:hypothetical protein
MIKIALSTSSPWPYPNNNVTHTVINIVFIVLKLENSTYVFFSSNKEEITLDRLSNASIFALCGENKMLIL